MDFSKENIQRLLSPIPRIINSGNEVEYRDYWKISQKRPDIYKKRHNSLEDNKYEMYLDYSSTYGISMSVTIFMDDNPSFEGVEFKISSSNDYTVLSKSMGKNEVTEYHFNLFIDTIKVEARRMEEIRRINREFKEIPQDYLRKYKINDCIN